MRSKLRRFSMKPRILREKEVTFHIVVYPEYLKVRGNVQRSDDEASDRESEDIITKAINSGNPWAWCVVEVRAEYNGFCGSDFLGGCSYDNEAEFIADWCYEDMKCVALLALNCAISQVYDRIPK